MHKLRSSMNELTNPRKLIPDYVGSKIKILARKNKMKKFIVQQRWIEHRPLPWKGRILTIGPLKLFNETAPNT